MCIGQRAAARDAYREAKLKVWLRQVPRAEVVAELVRIGIVVVALCVHEIMATILGAGDPLHAIVVDGSIATGVAIGLLLLLRLWLILIVPGWLVYRVALFWWARRAA